MRANFKSTALAVLGVASLAIAVPIGIANAQDPGQRTDQRVVRGQQTDQRRAIAGRDQARAGEMQRMMQRMGGGGGTAIAQDGIYLYIVQGGQVFKVTKKDLEVVAVGRLPIGRGMDRPPTPGEPGQRRQRGGGGGDRRNPPPESSDNPFALTAWRGDMLVQRARLKWLREVEEGLR